LDGKDLNGALADCNESLRLRPNDGNTLNSRGLVDFKLGAFDAAIADYNAAVAQNANDADSVYARGVAKLKKGDSAGGNADIAAATAIKPGIAAISAGYGITADAASVR
jgi:tetratricopeptide (TPR) repeat protein